jgi:hypothetical protein
MFIRKVGVFLGEPPIASNLTWREEIEKLSPSHMANTVCRILFPLVPIETRGSAILLPVLIRENYLF